MELAPAAVVGREGEAGRRLDLALGARSATERDSASQRAPRSIAAQAPPAKTIAPAPRPRQRPSRQQDKSAEAHRATASGRRLAPHHAGAISSEIGRINHPNLLFNFDLCHVRRARFAVIRLRGGCTMDRAHHSPHDCRSSLSRALHDGHRRDLQPHRGRAGAVRGRRLPAVRGQRPCSSTCIYFARRLWRALTVYTPLPARLRELFRRSSSEPGFIAILVPAWDEAAVIASMLQGDARAARL